MAGKDNKTECYFCEDCEMAYVGMKKACECEEGCKKNKVCNLEVMKSTINKIGVKK